MYLMVINVDLRPKLVLKSVKTAFICNYMKEK